MLLEVDCEVSKAQGRPSTSLSASQLRGCKPSYFSSPVHPIVPHSHHDKNHGLTSEAVRKTPIKCFFHQNCLGLGVSS